MEEAKFQYMLRRTLPLWSWERIATETIAHAVKAGIEEIIWIIDPEDFTHGLPTLDFMGEYLPVLQKIKAMQAPYGIRFSVNPWVTLGHVERGRDMTQVHTDIAFMTDQHGAVSRVIACPLSPGWHRWIGEAYRLYASLSPYILWLEDDFRLFNHESIVFGCFCPRHLEEFAKICGHFYTREELLSVLLQPGKPHPHRALWLEWNGSVLIKGVETIEKAVHSISPNTQLGLMCSSPGSHAAEGRRWHPLLQALCGDTQERPVARPSMGSYNEFEALDVWEGLDGARLTTALLPPSTLICPELESCFYSTFSKSVRHTRLQVGLSGLMGATHLTMNLYDFLGGEISKDDPFMAMLGQVKPKMNALAQLEQYPPSSKDCGSVYIPFAPEGGKDMRLETADSLHQLAPDSTGWARALQPCGLPISFERGQVQAVTGQYFESKTPAEILDSLSRPLLLDGSAAFSLQRLGYGEYLGLRVVELFSQNQRVLGAEEFHHPEFGGRNEAYMTLITTTHAQRFAHLVAEEETEIVSSLTDPDRTRILPCLTAYENILGGKVAVYAGDLSQGFSRGLKTCFLNPLRVEQLGGVVRWLSSDKILGLQNKSGAYHLTITRRYQEFLYIGLANLSTDSCQRLQFRLWNLPPIAHLYGLGESRWQPIAFVQTHNQLLLEKGLDYKDFTALVLCFTSQEPTNLLDSLNQTKDVMP